MRSIVVLLCLIVAGIAVQVSPVSAAPQQPVAESKVSAAGPVNLNTATAAQLEKLPGIGPKMAARIIEYRQKNGGYKKIEELMNVRGLGEKGFVRIKGQITVAPAKPDVP